WPRDWSSDVCSSDLDMRMAIEVVEEAFRQLADRKAVNVPRVRAKAPGVVLHTMSAAAEYLGLVGWKAYATTRGGAQFHAGLYDKIGRASCRESVMI